MTTRLEQAMQKAAALPVELQDQLADQLAEDIDGELRWDQTLALPQAQDLLDQLASDALREDDEGKTHTKGFEEL